MGILEVHGIINARNMDLDYVARIVKDVAGIERIERGYLAILNVFENPCIGF